MVVPRKKSTRGEKLLMLSLPRSGACAHIRIVAGAKKVANGTGDISWT